MQLWAQHKQDLEAGALGSLTHFEACQKSVTTWTPKVCKTTAFWALFICFGPFFYIPLGSMVLEQRVQVLRTLELLGIFGYNQAYHLSKARLGGLVSRA